MSHQGGEQDDLSQDSLHVRLRQSSATSSISVGKPAYADVCLRPPVSSILWHRPPLSSGLTQNDADFYINPAVSSVSTPEHQHAQLSNSLLSAPSVQGATATAFAELRCSFILYEDISPSYAGAKVGAHTSNTIKLAGEGNSLVNWLCLANTPICIT